ncbi:MAG: hypothetical protein QM662_08515 [Gordonia sp. (in: high G+C Gram-positive bacteria)]
MTLSDIARAQQALVDRWMEAKAAHQRGEISGHALDQLDRDLNAEMDRLSALADADDTDADDTPLVECGTDCPICGAE